MKKLILMLLVLVGGVIQANADNVYYIASNTENNGADWKNQGQMTDEDGDGTYSYILDIHVKVWVSNETQYFDQQFFTICTSSTFSWDNVYRPTNTEGNFVITNNTNGNVVTMSSNASSNDLVITYPNSWQDTQYKNYASAIKIDFTPSTNQLVVTRLISVVSDYNNWSKTVDYLAETSNGSKIYSGEAALNTLGFKFYFHENGWDYYGSKTSANKISNKEGSSNTDNATVAVDGMYSLTANLSTWDWTAPSLVTVSATVPTNGYSTFSSQYALDFTGITDVIAYRAASAVVGTVKMTQVTGKVPAGVGLFLKGVTTTIPTTICTESIGDNLLVAGTSAGVPATDATNNKYRYVFALQNNELAFYNVASAISQDMTGKAYLETTESIKPSNAPIFIDFGGTTGIEDVKREVINDNQYYTLDGRRVMNPTKGLYIVNGKKVIVK